MRRLPIKSLSLLLLVGALCLAAAPRARAQGVSVRDMDIYYSERLDMVNLSGRVLDLRDILLSNQDEDLTLPQYTWLPNYTVRLWLQNGPKKKLAINEKALLLDDDFFDDARGIITLRHRDLGVLAEVWYGGQGIWGPTPVPVAPQSSASVMIPFQPTAGGGGVPALPGLPPLPGQPATGGGGGGGDFEFAFAGAQATQSDGQYLLAFKPAQQSGPAAIVGQLSQKQFTLQVVVSYPAVATLPPSLGGKRTVTAACELSGEAQVCGPVFLPQNGQATVVAMCSRRDSAADASSANPLVGAMLAQKGAGPGAAQPPFDCSARSQVGRP